MTQHNHHDHTHDDHTHDHDHGDAQIMPWVQVAILAGMGLFFAYNIVSGNLTNYINARFTWLSYVAAAIFLLLAAATAYEQFTHGGGHHHHHDDHDHEPLTWTILAIVALPLILGVLVPSRPLGASAVEGNLSTGAVGVDGGDVFARDPLEYNVLDWLRRINDSADLHEFDGQEADLLGFVYINNEFPADHFMVTRFVISCCVADAAAIGLPVIWAETDALVNDTWVQVRGHFELGDFGGNIVPILHAETLEIVPEPEHPYLYP